MRHTDKLNASHGHGEAEDPEGTASGLDVWLKHVGGSGGGGDVGDGMVWLVG